MYLDNACHKKNSIIVHSHVLGRTELNVVLFLNRQTAYGENMEKSNSKQTTSAAKEKPVLSSRCPKCGHTTQKAVAECSSCGVIFSRYVAAQKKKQERVKQQKTAPPVEETPAKGGFSWLQVAVVVLITFGVTFYYFSTKDKQDVAQAPAAVEQQNEQTVTSSTLRVANQSKSSGSTSNKNSVSFANAGDAIAQARKATVSIETPFGSGSGFFITSNYIVTNKHVVQVDSDEVEALRQEIEPRRKVINLEKKKIRDLKRKLKTITDEKTRKQIRIIIREAEKDIKEFEKNLKVWIDRLEAMEKPVYSSDIKVILEDGSEYVCDYLNVSSNNDLALLSVDVYDSVFLTRSSTSASLRQGDKVFTLGSPIGLRNTVTSGVFSGYRVHTETGHEYLQTDAPINPGNSGGPLIDENGFVHGINTMVLRNTEGIGFAIPINAAFEEFGDVLVQ